MSGSAQNMKPGSRFGDLLRERWLPLVAMSVPLAAFCSTAAYNILLGVTVALLLITRTPLRFPPIRLPIVLLIGLTLLSTAFSEDPAAALPQIRKFYLFLALPILYSTLRRPIDLRRLMIGMVAAGTLSGAWSLVQFYIRYRRDRPPNTTFYQSYVGDRITGFMSHWQTFAGEMMTVALILAALLMFAPRSRRMLAAGLASGVILSLALLLGWTRSIWPATIAGGLYLLWHWQRRWILAVPVLLVVTTIAAPAPIRERILSAFKPDTRLDSNEHRSVLRRAGMRIVRDHPLLGLGPEHVKGQRVVDYIPPDVPRPLPDNWWFGHLHNLYLQYAAERGVPALIALLWVIGKAVYDFARALPTLPAGSGDRRAALHAAIAVIAGILVGGWWEHNLGDGEVLMMLLTMIACGYAAADAAVQEDARNVRHAA